MPGNWVSKLFTNLIVDPASLRPSAAQGLPEVNDPTTNNSDNGTNDDNDAASERSSVDPSGDDSHSETAAAAPATDADLLQLLQDRVPSELFLRQLIEVATRRVRMDESNNTPFLTLWTDIMAHFPANGSQSTPEEIRVAREDILASLLTRRQQERGSGGSPRTAVWARNGMVFETDVRPINAEGSGSTVSRAAAMPIPPFIDDIQIKSEDESGSNALPRPATKPAPRSTNGVGIKFDALRRSAPSHRFAAAATQRVFPLPPPRPLQRHNAFVGWPHCEPPIPSLPASPEPDNDSGEVEEETQEKPVVKVEDGEAESPTEKTEDEAGTPTVKVEDGEDQNAFVKTEDAEDEHPLVKTEDDADDSAASENALPASQSRADDDSSLHLAMPLATVSVPDSQLRSTRRNRNNIAEPATPSTETVVVSTPNPILRSHGRHRTAPIHAVTPTASPESPRHKRKRANREDAEEGESVSKRTRGSQRRQTIPRHA
ncbi:hypothetical protein MSAN_01132500 [Mycena sanguinolenta]|uniref:Uncharacterized protein n=1 Tax=Mycena sanguinolenta TaxID=230812 RepID=A0A8H6YL22_9AGAR|nr:hypothetical protein MSAN_01132500 [Mycena sanguinolenta]